jgi:hypothetical protein
MSAAALDEIERLVGESDDADSVLRGVVAALVERGGCTWAGILFAEDDDLVLGPHAGEPDPGLRVQVPIAYEGTRVAELVVDGCDDADFLGRVAALIATHCLVGWDTAGEPWSP